MIYLNTSKVVFFVIQERIKRFKEARAMRADELKKKLDNAKLNVEKRKATIERQKSQLEKKKTPLLRCDWIDINKLDEIICDDSLRSRYHNETGDDLYWDICDYNSKEQELKDSYKKLEELQRIANNWKVKYDSAVVNESVLTKEIPKTLQSYRNELVVAWDKWDIDRRDKLIEEYKQQHYREFMSKHSCAEYELAHMDNDSIHKNNEKDADNLILDLYQRIFKYTGEITSWKYLHITHSHINGFVTGKDGDVKVESILAGGYNIQRLHVRVLVHKYESTISDTSENYKSMSIDELESLADSLGVECKKNANLGIYRMRLTMGIKKAKEN